MAKAWMAPSRLLRRPNPHPGSRHHHYPLFNTFLTSPSGQLSPAAITRTRL